MTDDNGRIPALKTNPRDRHVPEAVPQSPLANAG